MKYHILTIIALIFFATHLSYAMENPAPLTAIAYKLTLTPEQIKSAKRGSVIVSPEQLKKIRLFGLLSETRIKRFSNKIAQPITIPLTPQQIIQVAETGTIEITPEQMRILMQSWRRLVLEPLNEIFPPNMPEGGHRPPAPCLGTRILMTLNPAESGD